MLRIGCFFTWTFLVHPLLAFPVISQASGPTPPLRPVSVIGYGPYTSRQANVDAWGTNIPGDAANEPSIAALPGHPDRLVIGFRQFDATTSRFREAGYARSLDGGRTWSERAVLAEGVRGSDPVLRADADGNVFYMSLRYEPLLDAYFGRVFKSADVGSSWGDSVFAYAGDKPWIAIDRTPGPGRHHLYAVWSPFFTDPLFHFFSRSVDRGTSFEPPVTMDARPTTSTLAVGPDGTVYVAGMDFSPNAPLPRRVVVAWSTDARNASATPTFDSTRVDLGGSTVRGSGGYDTPNPDGYLGQVWIDVDGSSGPHSGNVYLFASVDPPGPDPMDVHFSRSEDGGRNWSPWIRVNDDASISAWQWFGTMAVGPDGRIHAAWNDTRGSLSMNWSQLTYTCSEDGGSTWAPNVQVSPAWDSYVGYPQDEKIGDYYDMAADQVGVHIAWAATFNNEQDVYCTRIGDHDCNDNGLPDTAEIADGLLHDWNHNDIPDVCEAFTRPGYTITVTGSGTMDGKAGHYLETVREGSLYRTDFVYELKGFLLLHAYLYPGGPGFTLYPANTILVRQSGLALNQTWAGWWNGPTTATVAALETVTIPGGQLPAYRVDHTAPGAFGVVGSEWYSVEFGPLRAVDAGDTRIFELHSRHVEGGSGVMPIAVGNWWSSRNPVGLPDDEPPRGRPLVLRAHPNPLSSTTRIEFELANPGRAALLVYDLRGSVVRTLWSGPLEAGAHVFLWDGGNERGERAGAGIYFVRLLAGATASARKLVLAP